MSGFGGFREVARAITTGYPIPFLLTALLTFATGCFATAAAVSDGLRWALFAVGLVVAGTTTALAVWIVLRRPQLLRHERVELIHRTLDIIGDKDLNAETTQSVSNTVTNLLAGPESHKATHTGKPKITRDDGHG